MSGDNFGLQTASGFLHVPEESKAPYADDVLDALRGDAERVVARYPQKRSAIIPLLHLVQSVDGYIPGRGIRLIAEILDLTEAEVSGVATFYTQFKRHPNGDYTVGVCTNTLCAIMGGDAIWEAVSAHLGVDHDETTPDGRITLERIECNAGCDYAPVVMANWEFFDNQTPESTTHLVDDLRAGKDVTPTRGANKVCTFKEISRVLAGFTDGRADEGVGAGPASLEGLRLARENGWTAPGDGHPGTQPEPGAPAPAAETTPEPVPVKGNPAIVADLPSKDGAGTPVEAKQLSLLETPNVAPAVDSPEGGPVMTVPAGPVASPVVDDPASGTHVPEPGQKDPDILAARARMAEAARSSAPAQPAAPEEPPSDTALVEAAYGPDSAVPGLQGEGPQGFVVKGKMSSMTFHTAGSPYFQRTRADVWFRDAGAASRAGFTDALEPDADGKDEA